MQDILVITALAGNRTIFTVRRDPADNWRLYGKTEQGLDDDDPGTLLNAVDRLVLYEQPDGVPSLQSPPQLPLLEIPVIPKSLQLGLLGNTASTRKVELAANVRCLVRGGEGLCRVKATLTQASPTTPGYSPIVFPRHKLQWWVDDPAYTNEDGDSDSNNTTVLPLRRDALLQRFQFRTHLTNFISGVPIPELGKLFGLTDKPNRMTLIVRAFSVHEVSEPLQLEFWADTTQSGGGGPSFTYRGDAVGFRELALKIVNLRWRQRPVGTVGGWPRARETRVLEPQWRVEMALPRATSIILAYYNSKVAAAVHGSLHVVREGMPLSLLPRLDPVPGATMQPDAWTMDVVIDRKASFAAHSGVIWPDGDGNLRIRLGMLRPGQLPPTPRQGDPFRDEPVREPVAAEGLLVTATFSCFRTTAAQDGSARPLQLPLLIHGRPRSEERLGATLLAEFALAAAVPSPSGGDVAAASAQEVRLGALELAFSGSVAAVPVLPLPGPSSLLTFQPLPEGVSGTPHPVLCDLDLSLPISRVGAAGQDPLPDEQFSEAFQLTPRTDEERAYEAAFRREPPLVLDLSGAEGPQEVATTAPYQLQIHEDVVAGESQTVSLTLQQTGFSARAERGRRYWVVDRDPFLVAEMRVPDARSEAGADSTNEIAVFSTRSGGTWAMTSGASGFELVLPPQGVGEAMEKNRASDGGRPPDVDEGRLVAFRFTPPAVFRVQPAYYRRRFAEPPWNLRRLLGFSGQRDPGMTVERIDFELLYGLAGRITRSDLRLAEIAARLGAVPGRQPATPLWRSSSEQNRVYLQHRGRWAQWYSLLLGRLAVLEPWQHLQGDRDLALTDGIRYALRASARMTFPVALSESQQPDLAVPRRTYLPLEQLNEEEQATVRSEAPGEPLAGGIAWPFESLNLYDRLWRTPIADAGELHRPFFSALGGWGYQKATFAAGLLRVYSDTAMGRTHSVTLEVLGRISVSWNLAKLVIVYERSVLPNRQFFNESVKEQDALRGRPVLRKVREYVEILEPLRRFPDNGAAAMEAGCLHGLEFPEGGRRIAVSSRWGEDVGHPKSGPDEAEGWKVPLWIRGARPADVYPKPQITALLAPAHGEAPVRADIDEPEKLFFFTSTKDSWPSDPHLWPAIQGVDFCWFTPAGTDAPDKPDGWRRGDLDAAPEIVETAVRGGLEPFTFALRPGSHAVDVMARRTDDPIGARLQNVTVMRGAIAEKLSSEVEAYLEMRDAVSAGVADARELIGHTVETLAKTEDGKGSVAAPLLQHLHRTLKPIRDKIRESTFSVPSPADLRDRLTAQVRRTLSPMRAAVVHAGHSFVSMAKGAIEDAVDVPAARAALEAAGAELRRMTSELVGRLAELEAAAAAAREVLAEALETASAAFAWLEEFERELEALPSSWLDAAAAWPDVVEIWRHGRNALREARGALDTAFATAARPWTGSLLDRFRVELGLQDQELAGAIKALLDSAFADIESALETGQEAYEATRRRLPESLERLQELRAQVMERWQSLLDDWVHPKLEWIGRKAKKTTEALRDEVGNALDPFLSQLSAIDGTLDELRRQASAVLAGMASQWEQAVQTAEETVVAGVGNITADLLASAHDFIDYLRTRFDEKGLDDWIEGTLGNLPSAAEVRQQLGELESTIGNAVRHLLGRASAAGGALQQLARPVLARTGQVQDTVLRLVRAFGDAPRVASLDFRLPGLPSDALAALRNRTARIGYYFQDLAAKIPLPHVDITPVLAEANRLGNQLINGLEVRLPSTRLLERFLPASLPNFDLSKIFPNFAGLRLDQLFSGVKLPSNADDGVRVTHGEDPQSLQGWLQVEVDQRFAKPASVFALAGLAMQISGARFRASARIEGGVGTPPRQTFRGEISGDWELTVGGMKLVRIENTALRFDGGRLTYDVRPNNVKLPGPLAWLADLVAKLDLGNKGFHCKTSPSGARTSLDLPLPDVQGGAFGLANLRLGFFLELTVLGQFRIDGGVNVASRQAPFTLTVFILGGAGWFDLRYGYVPATRELQATVSIGIMAAASLAISLGPISGGVHAYFGIVVEHEARTGRAGHLVVTLVLRFVGHVSLLGIVSAYVELGLEAQYRTGGGLEGRGYLRVRITICWFFTLNISCSVSYTFGRASGGEASSGPPHLLAASSEGAAAVPAPYSRPVPSYEEAAKEYVDMFA